MSAWVMIVAIWTTHGAATAVVPMHDRAACVAAATVVKRDYSDDPVLQNPVVSCVQTGEKP